MSHIDVAGFERKFRENVDPWNYRRSRFERHKRQMLLNSCGCAKRGRGLELACANGETTRNLAKLCMRLIAVDGSPTVLTEARQRVVSPQVQFQKTILPNEMPRGPFDLIVVSEIAYYLTVPQLAELARRLTRGLARGGRIVILHHRQLFGDAAQHSGVAHRELCRRLGKKIPRISHAAFAKFDIATFQRGPSPSQRSL